MWNPIEVFVNVSFLGFVLAVYGVLIWAFTMAVVGIGNFIEKRKYSLTPEQYEAAYKASLEENKIP